MPETTNSTTVALTITCPTDIISGTNVQMYISGAITGTPTWENCTSTKNVTLTSGDGVKDIYIKFKDSLGNESIIINQNINYIILGTYPGCDSQDILVGNYIISSCNVGASKSIEYNLCIDLSSCTTPRVGNIFQWGNNGIMSYNSATTTSQVNTSSFGNGNYYSNTNFIKGFSDWSTITNNNLWGGENVTINNINDTNKNNMKGPCQNGYYIPTSEQWKDIIFNITGKYSGFTLTEVQNVQNKLKIPLGGSRNWSTGNYSLPGGMNYFWSSDADINNSYPSGGRAFIMYYDPPTISVATTMAKANGFFVRCIKK